MYRQSSCFTLNLLFYSSDKSDEWDQKYVLVWKVTAANGIYGSSPPELELGILYSQKKYKDGFIHFPFLDYHLLLRHSWTPNPFSDK